MDRNRVRNYKSGASKRRKLKENDMKSSEELTKMKRMEQYFNKNTSNDNNNINEDEPCDTSLGRQFALVEGLRHVFGVVSQVLFKAFN